MSGMGRSPRPHIQGQEAVFRCRSMDMPSSPESTHPLTTLWPKISREVYDRCHGGCFEVRLRDNHLVLPAEIFWRVKDFRCKKRSYQRQEKNSVSSSIVASAQQLIGLVKSHAEGDADRFFDLAMQLSAAEEQKGHTRLAEQLRQ